MSWEAPPGSWKWCRSDNWWQVHLWFEASPWLRYPDIVRTGYVDSNVSGLQVEQPIKLYTFPRSRIDLPSTNDTSKHHIDLVIKGLSTSCRQQAFVGMRCSCIIETALLVNINALSGRETIYHTQFDSLVEWAWKSLILSALGGRLRGEPNCKCHLTHSDNRRQRPRNRLLV